MRSTRVFYGADPAFATELTTTGSAKGLLTASKTKVLDDNNIAPLLCVNYYDEQGRLCETVKANHLGGMDRIRNTYDFQGLLTASYRSHYPANNSPTTLAYTYTYDHAGRPLNTALSLNSAAQVILSAKQYNEIGQLKQKALHSTNSGTSFAQTNAYAYNERGWLKAVSSPQFSFKLAYDTLSNPQYNGNIRTQIWGANDANQFNYTYDALNRLTQATSTGIAMSESLTYDKMGNISTLNRDGQAATYAYSGNRLTAISGGSLTTGTYSYDANGNVTTDGRNASTIAYNLLNLPALVWKNEEFAYYTYDAAGLKLQKSFQIGETVTKTDYVDGFHYLNDNIDFIQTPEGILKKSGYAYNYQYNLTDHLGNVRCTFDIYSGAPRRLQEDNYYAFGLRKSAGSPVALDNKYLFNGKELQGESAQYDYGARFYDPVIARWNSVDPLAEKNHFESPYVYVHNNPIIHIDPDGRDGIIIIKGGKININSNIYLYGAGATKAVASQYQKDINSRWGGAFNTKTSDGKQSFDVGVNVNVALYRGKEKNNPLMIPESWNPYNRDNFIEVGTGNKRSYVIGGDEGEWRSQGRGGLSLAQDNPAPHELGHLLGLNDRYADGNGPNKGWENNIMGNSQKGKVEQRNIDGILYDAMKAYEVWSKDKNNAGKEFRYEINTRKPNKENP